jgi:flagellar biosynthesis/type III secretory pathway M-ring protein FliF/YscJ
VSTFIDQEAAVSNDREPELNIDRQKQIAATAVDALSADSKQELVGNVVQSVGTDQKKQIAATAVEALPQADKEDVAASILGIPDRKTQQKLWYIVVGMMGGAIFVFGILTFVLVLVGKSAEGVVALATTALGGVVGLVSTSPVSSRRLH